MCKKYLTLPAYVFSKLATATASLTRSVFFKYVTYRFASSLSFYWPICFVESAYCETFRTTWINYCDQPQILCIVILLIFSDRVMGSGSESDSFVPYQQSFVYHCYDPQYLHFDPPGCFPPIFNLRCNSLNLNFPPLVNLDYTLLDCHRYPQGQGFTIATCSFDRL